MVFTRFSSFNFAALLILLKCSHLVFLKCKSYPVISFLNIKTAQDFPFPLGESSEVAAGLCFTQASECLMDVLGCAVWPNLGMLRGPQ